MPNQAPEHNAAPIRIVVADDHPVVRDGLVAILGTQPDFLVVGEAADGAGALAQVAAERPDILLLDLAMPGLDGVAVLQRLQASGSPTRSLVFTAFDTDERILGAVRAGAQGYLLKGAPREELFSAIRTIRAGGSTLQPLVASKLLRQVQAPAAAAALTEREAEVLRLLASGLPNKLIAAELSITQRTAKFHVSAILQKLGARNRTEAVTLARGRGLID
ncbi:MAG TPA: response regulator transcription factor [Herpetosiphonaceae bacterium]|nr:response regulator transcription factor [Herpetosiphonaceae bacterium]